MAIREKTTTPINISRGFIKFDLRFLKAQIQNGGNITACSLRVNLVGGVTTASFRLEPVYNDDWYEDSVTYRKQPRPYNPNNRFLINTAIGTPNPRDFASPELLTYIRSQVRDTANGFISFRITGNSTNTYTLATKEHPNLEGATLIITGTNLTPSGPQPPVATFTPLPATGAAPLLVNFDAGASSDDSTITDFDWDFAGLGTATGEQTSFTFTNVGSYIVRLVVTDNSSLTDTTYQTITVTAPLPPTKPVAVISVPNTSALVNQSLTFSGNLSTDVNNNIVSFNWNFGDGTSASGVTAAKTYSTPGNYIVKLIVIDGTGLSDSTTVSITVVNAAAGNFTLFETVADAHVRSTPLNNNNYGRLQTIDIRGRDQLPGETKWGFFKFDLSSLKAAVASGAVIDSVKLQVYRPSGNGTGSFGLTSIANDNWLEDSITRSNCPTAGPVLFQTTIV
jgi:PKD repeat protein